MNLVKTVEGGMVCPDDPGEECYASQAKRVGVTEHEAQILARWLENQVVLEIGTGLGVSTRAIAETAIEVYTVDPSDWVHDHVVPYLPSNVLALRSLDGVPACEAAFIDGDHTYDAVLGDCLYAIQHLPKGADVFVHDYTEDVKSAADIAGLVLIQEFKTPFNLALCRTPES